MDVRAWLSSIMKTMNSIRSVKGATIAALMALAACGGDRTSATEVTAPNSIIAGTVTASRVAGGVAIANGTERAVGYAVANPSWLGLLATCSDPSPSCLRLKPGGTVTVPPEDIYGWSTQATDAVVYWWQVLPTSNGGYQATEVKQVSLSLRP